MYLYVYQDFDEEVSIFSSEQKYTQEEFSIICKSYLEQLQSNCDSCNETISCNNCPKLIRNWLVKEKGFTLMTVQAEFYNEI